VTGCWTHGSVDLTSAQFEFDSTAWANGSHTYQVTVTDSSDRTATASLSSLTDNPAPATTSTSSTIQSPSRPAATTTTTRPATTTTAPRSGLSAGATAGTGAKVGGSLVVAGGPAQSKKLVAPGRPVKVTAAIFGSGVKVSWSAPAGKALLPITRYKVTANPGNRSCVATGKKMYCLVSNLSAGKRYIFSVVATSKAGSGPAGTTSFSIPARQIRRGGS